MKIKYFYQIYLKKKSMINYQKLSESVEELHIKLKSLYQNKVT